MARARARIVLPLAAALLTLAPAFGPHPAAGQTASPAASQEKPPAQPPVFRTGVDVLAVDVSVIDGKGQPVPDLLAPEFTVKVNGEVRKIVSAEFVSFEEVTTTTQPEETVSSNAGRSAARLIVLVVDQGNIRAGAGRAALRAAARFVERLNREDQVMLAAIPGPGARVDFTTDRLAIQRALARVVGLAPDRQGSFNLGLSEAIALQRGSDPLTIKSVLDRECGGVRVGLRESEQCVREVFSEAVAFVRDLARQSSESIQALRQLLDGLRQIDAPKTLVFISESLVATEVGTDVVGLADAAAAARTSIYVMALDVSFFDVTRTELPTTPAEDRRLQTEGLEMLAGAARGTLFHLTGSGDVVFERIRRELSGYYLLGVELTPGDRDAARFRINVEVRRRGTSVRWRREFRWTPAMALAITPTDRVIQALRSPVPAPHLPLRVASYVYRDTATKAPRVLLTAEVGGDTSEPTSATIGLVLLDQDGRVVEKAADLRTVSPPGGAGPGPLYHTIAVAVEPGTYLLRLAAVDAENRLGSIERPVRVFDFSQEELAVSDLLLAEATKAGADTLPPQVETRLAGRRLAAHMELYSSKPDLLRAAQVRVEVAETEDSPPLVQVPARVMETDEPDRRVAQAVLAVDVLPPGAYVARAIVSTSGRTVGKLARPLRLLPPARAATPPSSDAGARLDLPPTLLPAAPPFDRKEALRQPVINDFLAVLERRGGSRGPAVRKALERARHGSLQGTGRLAFEDGDQLTAAFLRGLELLAQDQLTAAARQFEASLQIDTTFAPGAFYLGVCYAAGGRDREATTLWQRTLKDGSHAAIVYRLLADAWLRLGDAARTAPLLHEALGRWPEDDQIRRSLGLAYVAAQRLTDASVALDPYLTRHPTDHETLLVAIYAIYATHATGSTIGSLDEDRERLARYAAQYVAANGPQRALVEKWREFVQGVAPTRR